MLKVDDEVFKIIDPRVAALAKARLPVRQFINTIRPNDWFIFLNGTVYALTETQYYAVQHMNIRSQLTQDQFQEILTKPPEEFAEQDKNQLLRIKSLKKGCSTCQYKSFKSKIFKLLLKYPAVMERFGLATEVFDIPDYPEVKGSLISKVSRILPKFFQTLSYQRTSCLDCVQKHISQAFVKGCQSQQGYPEHLKLALANLQEAYEECPKDCEALRDLILFCIGKTKKDNRIFVPIANFLYLIELSRVSTHSAEALQQNQTDQTFALELSDEMKEALSQIPLVKKAKILGQVDQLLKYEYSDQISSPSAMYQGALANIADELVDFCPDVSNVLRNRRLVFKAAPQLTRNTEYDCKDLKEALLQTPKDQEKN